MDSDSGDFLQSVKVTKIALLTLVFTACFFYKSRQNEPILRLTVSKKDSVINLSVKQKKPVKSKKKTIYLTFDDGPNKGTQNVIDIINQEEIDATLFIVGEHVYGSSMQNNVFDSVMSSRFIEVANHSYTHAFHNHFSKYYSVPDSVVKDFERCADSLQLTSNIIRTPGRNIWRINNIRQTDIVSSIAAADSLQKKGFTIMGWDLEWFYNDQLKAKQSTEEMASQVDSMFEHNQNKTEGHLVLLAHDQVFSNSKDSGSLHRFVTRLKEKGEYDFAMVKEYPGANFNSTTDTTISIK